MSGVSGRGSEEGGKARERERERVSEWRKKRKEKRVESGELNQSAADEWKCVSE